MFSPHHAIFVRVFSIPPQKNQTPSSISENDSGDDCAILPEACGDVCDGNLERIFFAAQLGPGGQHGCNHPRNHMGNDGWVKHFF